MAVFRVERNKGYTVMSNHHLRNKELSLKAKGLLSQMLSLPEDWDYTLKGLSLINREKIDAIREAIKELERAGYIVRSRERDEKGRLRGADYVIFEQPQPPTPDLPTLENPTYPGRLGNGRNCQNTERDFPCNRYEPGADRSRRIWLSPPVGRRKVSDYGEWDAGVCRCRRTGAAGQSLENRRADHRAERKHD